MAIKCRMDGLKKNGRLRKGFKYAKGRKKCPVKVGKGKPWSTARRLKYGKTVQAHGPGSAPTAFSGARRRRRAKR